jgi:TM2 domain-containing membrane protein YozV
MSEAQYFYAENDQQRGPLSAAELIALRLSPATLVWRDGLANWQRLDSVPELTELLRQSAPPPPSIQPGSAPIPPVTPTAPFPPGQPQPFAIPIGYTNAPPRDDSKRIVAGIFGLLMGALGIHKFILGYTGAGLVMCLITVFTCGYGALIFGPIGFVEGIIYLSASDEDFYQRYVVRRRPWF